MDREAGQATVELIAALPAIVLAGLIALQLGLAGYSMTLADGAAEAGALALATGTPVKPAVREALPGWAKGAAEIAVEEGRVTVTVHPPSPIPFLGERLAATSTAFARSAAD
jgi:hypothetical protein